jgi:hypothetical protein
LRARSLLAGFCFLTLAALPAGAVNIVTRAGAPTGFWSSSIAASQYASWTQAAGTSFSSVTITITAHSIDGNPATGTAFLTNAIGPGTTTANQLATAPISISTAVPTPITLTLTPSFVLNASTTYFLTVNDTTANLALDFASVATETTAAGVTTNNDGLATVANAYPPASTFTAPGSPAKGILFSVNGTVGIPTTPPPASVPAVSTLVLLATAVLLGSGGLLLVRKFAVQD